MVSLHMNPIDRAQELLKLHRQGTLVDNKTWAALVSELLIHFALHTQHKDDDE